MDTVSATAKRQRKTPSAKMRSATLWLNPHRRCYRERLVHPVRYNRYKRRLAKCDLSRPAKQRERKDYFARNAVI